jgi:AsmA protein
MAVRPRAAQPALAPPVLRNPAASAGRSEAGWSRQSLGLASLGEMDADIALSARLLSMDKLKLADARLALKLRETTAALTSLSGSVYGGRLEGSASLDLRQAPVLSATGTLTGVELRQVLELLAGADALRGPADLRFDLRASGDSQAALIATLAGTLQIASPGGTIEGYDLPQMSERLKRIDRPTDLITLVQLGLGGGRTPFTDLEGNLRIENSVARTDDLKLVAQAGEMRTTGTIDLPRWSLDLVNEFRLTEHPKLPPLALKISGPIDAPRRIFDIERLQSYLLRRGSDGQTR